ncbi:hypothetical protein [Burkholderia sp. Ac-20344]|uniref:hypothetical protein n=1 Tax=Burkholderia sp. Ac-20344 TaxID=2703890 RepID=UPI00197BBFC0|nr:hypothetical protein [Burkholderia sp. Ac-20344]MBN3836260.1 hypothetical protein [Burkholderia sp. Ac-20344]
MSKYGVERTAVLTTSFWLAAGRIHMNGCYKNGEELVEIDRSVSIKTLFGHDGDLLSKVCSMSYSPFDNGTKLVVPDALESPGCEVGLHFSKVTDRAWIVQTDDNRAGMCLVEK